jgi:succinate dehydrogenase / fumarate reductase membrane anchor subunit
MKRNGVHEWIFQRCSTLLITAYTIVYISLVLSMQTYDYASWVKMHNATWFEIYTTITLTIVMINSLLAGWQIGTDYTQKVPIAGFGTIFHSFYIIITISILALGLYIVWLL